MTEDRSYHGDSLPPPPPDRRQPDSLHFTGRIGYRLRALGLRLLHRSPRAVSLPPREFVGRLVVVQLESLAELVLAEPALRGLRMHYPEAERVLVAKPFAKELFAGSGWGTIRGPELLGGLVDNPGYYDVAIDLTGGLELDAARTFEAAKIAVRIGLDRGGRGVYYTFPVRLPEIGFPMREVYLRLTGLTGAVPEDSIPRLPCGEERLLRGTEGWREQGLERPVVLVPGADESSRDWPLDGFATVGRILLERGIDTAVISGPGDQHLGRALAEEVGAQHIADPPVRFLMDLLAASSTVLGNNSGPLHLAAALNVPTVCMLDSPLPWRWWPASDAACIVFRHGSSLSKGERDKPNPIEVAEAVLFARESHSTRLKS